MQLPPFLLIDFDCVFYYAFYFSIQTCHFFVNSAINLLPGWQLSCVEFIIMFSCNDFVSSSNESFPYFLQKKVCSTSVEGHSSILAMFNIEKRNNNFLLLSDINHSIVFSFALKKDGFVMANVIFIHYLSTFLPFF